MRYLILGSGPAGIAAAKAARKFDRDAEVILATEEHAAPYLRPLLPDLVPASGTLWRSRPAGEGPRGRRGDSSAESARAASRLRNRVTFSDGTEET